MNLPSLDNHFLSSFFFSNKRKGKSSVAWLIVIGGLLFFLAFFAYGLTLLVSGNPLQGVVALSAFMLVLWLTVQVITL